MNESTSKIKEYAALSFYGCDTSINDFGNPTQGIVYNNKFANNPDNLVKDLLVNYELIDSYTNVENGYSGYAYKNTITGELIVVNEGSHAPGQINSLLDLVDFYNDWVTENLFGIGFDNIPSQLESADEFLSKIMSDYKDMEIKVVGQSLGGGLTQALGMMDKYKDLEMYCYNPPGMEHLANDMVENGYILSNDNTNINNIISCNEPLSLFFKQAGNCYKAINGDTGDLITNHFVDIHIDNDLIYIEADNLVTLESILSKYNIPTPVIEATSDAIKFIISNNGNIIAAEILKSIVLDLEENGYLNSTVLQGYVSMDGCLYTIMPSDTIWGICEKYGTTQEELLELNPWLSERTNEDGSYILIRPDEKLLLPGDTNLGIDKTEDIYEQFREAQEVVQLYDPLILDLDGDGIETTTVADGKYFDHGQDGFAESSAWVGKDDAILAMDKDGNGEIDNGNEIFGDNYIKSDGNKAKSGFDALSDLDTNKDGIINSEDEAFSQLKLLKGDGTLLSLEDAGITSIDLTNTETDIVDENGNTQGSTGIFTKTDGTTGEIGDYLLQNNIWDSKEKEVLEVPDDIAALPDIKASGTLHSLHQAMVRDESGELKQLVEQFINGEPGNRKSIVNQLLYKWTGADKVTVRSGGAHYDGQKLYILEQFLGEEYVGFNNTGEPRTEAAGFLDNALAMLQNQVYAQLATQTYMKPIFDLLVIEYDIATNTLSYNLDNVQAYIDNAINENITNGRVILKDFAEIFLALGLEKNSNYSSFYEHYVSMGSDYELLMQTLDKILIYGDEESSTITGTAQAEAVFGGAGADKITTRQGNDIVYGGAGDDYIDVCEGNDIVFGEAGDDTIIGGAGNDTYIYNVGDGNDTITDTSGTDTIQFGEGISAENLIFRGLKNDLIITFNNTEGSIIIKNFCLNSNYRIENFNFSDGSELTSQDILASLVVKGDTTVNTLTGSEAGETIYSYEGNDTINALGGNDKIYGGTGDDIINSGKGNDTIIYNLGDGNDTIMDNGGTDTLQFGEGISAENLIFKGLKNDLIISFTDNEGSIIIKNFCSNSNYRIENFKFSDGSSLSLSKVLTMLVTEGDATDNTLTGSETGETIYGYEGNDTINALGGNDKIYAGEGNDTINSGSGNDIITGGTGDDKITDTSGNDTYIYNFGDGNDTIKDTYGTDTLQFGEGISKENIKFLGLKNDLIISFTNSEDSIVLKDFCSSTVSRIEKFTFADGSILTSEQILSILEVKGDESDNTLTGSEAGETIYGYGGNDTIDSLGGNDKIYAGEGNDTINSGSGNSIIVGGSGDDIITNDFGNDTYIYNVGDGNDIISDYQGTDTLKFGEGISKENIKFQGLKNDLIISFTDTEGSLVIKNFCSNTNYRIENFRFSDGSIITSQEILTSLVVEGDAGDNALTGSAAGETIYGYGGDDTINALGGNDIIYGGAGNDVINSSAGNDTYIYNLGDGHDTISDYQGTDTLRFGTGILPENLRFSGENNDLIITLANTEGSIRIKNYLTNTNYRIENIKFEDVSTIISPTEVLQNLVTVGDDSDNILTGSFLSETIYGNGGNDTIKALDGNDTIYGGAGNDVINSSSGDDTYIYNLGDGHDTISDYRGTDTLKFGTGILPENLRFSGENDDLIITITNAEGSIRVKNYLTNTNYRIENIKFKDISTVISPTEVLQNLVTVGDDSDNILTGCQFSETIYGYSGDDAIKALDGNDTIYGGAGNDIINLGYGNDTVTGGTGDDVITDADGGNDTYIYNLGDGHDMISDYTGTDTLKFGAGISPEDLRFTYVGDDLRIVVGDEEGSICIKNFLTNSNYQIETIAFEDTPEVITSSQVLNSLELWGDVEDNTLVSNNYSQRIYGYGGNDTITGGSGNDIIVGGSGDDVITDTEGGNDTYIYNLGDGHDTIKDYIGTADVLKFGKGISPEDIRFSFIGDDLRIVVGNEVGSIRIKNFLSNSNYRIETIAFEDSSTTISSDEVLKRLELWGDDNNNTLTGSSYADTIYGHGGDDTILSNGGNDTIYGGAGNDTITLDSGNETVIGNWRSRR